MSRLEDKMRVAMKLEVRNGKLDTAHGALAAAKVACEYFNREKPSMLTKEETHEARATCERLMIEINEGRIERPHA